MFGANGMSLVDWGEKEAQQAERERLLLAAAIRSVFETENGKKLKAWLRTACFMDDPMNRGEIESPAQTQRIAARRDLFIVLESLEKEGANVSSNE